jgi:hypothetical protein
MGDGLWSIKGDERLYPAECGDSAKQMARGVPGFFGGHAVAENHHGNTEPDFGSPAQRVILNHLSPGSRRGMVMVNKGEDGAKMMVKFLGKR